MIANPVFDRELRSAVRHGRVFLVAGLYAMALGGLAIQVWPSQSQALFGSRLGEQIFEQFRKLQLALALGLAPALTWSAISAEREQRTWGTLRATPLRTHQIVLGKLACAMVQLLLFILASLPVTCYCFFLGGVSPVEVRAAYASALLASLAAGCVGLACSALMRKTYLAIGLAYLLIGAMAALLWPFNAHWRTTLVAFIFFLIAVRRCRSTSEREVASESEAELDDRGREGASAPLDFAGNLVAARELATAQRSRGVVVALGFFLSLALPVLLGVALFRYGLPSVRAVFPWFAVSQMAMVMVVAASVGGYALAAEKELRTFPLLLSTPLSATTILRGKLLFALWHIAVLVLMSVPVLVCAAVAQLISFGELFALLVVQFAYGLAFAVIGLFFSLRASRTNRALGMTLAFLLFISTVSFQVLPLSRGLAAGRGGQLLMATNPLQTVWEREQPMPWEKITPVQRRKSEIAAAARTMPRMSFGRRVVTSPAPAPPDEARWFATLDDLPGLSVLGASVAFYLSIAGFLWCVMHVRFRVWSLPG